MSRFLRFAVSSLCLSVALSQNMDCALIIPPNPLSKTGLSTPFYLTALNPANGPCNQVNPVQSSFVQGAVFDLDKNTISIYNPLVIDQGTTPAVAPTVPNLPKNYVAALWFGTNANTLTLLNTPNTNSVEQGSCVNGGGNTYSIFGQFAYCNAPAFFTAANNAIESGALHVPHLGTAIDGSPCPTVRDFSVVDQDQSDNVVTVQLQSSTGIVVQDTAANRTMNVTMDTGMMQQINAINPNDTQMTTTEINMGDAAVTASSSSAVSVLGPLGIALLVLVVLLIACVSCGVRPDKVHAWLNNCADRTRAKTGRPASSSVDESQPVRVHVQDASA